MIVHARLSALKESRWYEYLVRFLLGGMTTFFAGVIADWYGPTSDGSSIRLDFLVPYFYAKRKKRWYQKTPWPAGYGPWSTNRHALVG